jgi:hypothetical protein
MALHSLARSSQGVDSLAFEDWVMKRVLVGLSAVTIAIVSVQGRAIAGEYSQSDVSEEIRQKVSIPVLLPTEAVVRQHLFDQGETIYEYSRASGQNYHVTFSTNPNCGDANACLRFSVGGTRGKAIDTTLPDTKGSSEYIRLSDGSKALAKKQCGASCWGVVQWKSKGVLYEVWTKARNYQAAIAIANSMVKGDRSKAFEKRAVGDRSADLVAVSNWQWSIFDDIRISDFVVSKK